MRLSPTRQITLPLAIVKRAGLQVGDELSVDTDEAGRVIISRTADRELGERRRRALERAAGALPDVWPPGGAERIALPVALTARSTSE